MEYYRQPNGKIQADFALRAGRLLSQYATLSASLQESERYEATLTVCILHSILTNCLELIGELKKHHWDSPIKDVPGLFGICRSFVVRNAFPGEVTYAKFIEHIRNALCHPTIAEKKPKLPSTGYTTIPGSGLISKFSFVHSPWVHSGRMDFRANHKSKDKVEKFAKDFAKGHASELTVRLNYDSGRYQIHYGEEEEVYYPIFEAEMSVADLHSLALQLANYLAQPTIDNWDGETIRQLVA